MNGNTPDVGVMMTAVVQRSMDMADTGWTVSTAPSAVQLSPHVAVPNQTFSIPVVRTDDNSLRSFASNGLDVEVIITTRYSRVRYTVREIYSACCGRAQFVSTAYS